MRPGCRVGKYVIGERIAVGGMAEVWSGHAVGPEGFVKPVAIKFILEPFSGDPQFERLFVNEARLAAALQHPNLVSVFDFDRVARDDGRGPSYIVMELVEGHDLRRIQLALQRQGRTLPVPVALHIAGEVLKGLRYLHERSEGGRPLGLIHRDVSPHNVMIDVHGQVKLSDFGIAKAMTQSLGTQAGTIRGKLAYASPEQIRGEPVSSMTDQFSAGVILWEMLAGRRLFEGANDVEVIATVARCHVPPLASLGLTVAPEIETITRRMLAPAAGHRFPTTAEALAAVLHAPGYWADGMGLGALVSELLPDGPIETGATEPLRPVANAPTVLLPSDGPRPAFESTAGDEDEISVDRLSEAETRTRVPRPADGGLETTPSMPPVATENSAPDALPASHQTDSTEMIRPRWRQNRYLQAAVAVAVVLAALAAVTRGQRGGRAALPSPQTSRPEAAPLPAEPPAAAAAAEPAQPVLPSAAEPAAPGPVEATDGVVATGAAQMAETKPATAVEDVTASAPAAPRRTGARAAAARAPRHAAKPAAAGPASEAQMSDARAAFNRGEFPRAVREARRALLNGAGPPALALLGDALFKLGRTQEARQAYAQALRKDPRNVAAQHGLQVLAATP